MSPDGPVVNPPATHEVFTPPAGLTSGMPATDSTLQAELAQLRDVIAPAPVPWWPPAPGWWIVLALLLLVTVVCCVWYYKRHQRFLATRYQREAASLLDTLPDAHDTLQQLQHIARVLRRAAISAYGRERVGTLPWLELAVLPCSDVLDEKSLLLLGSALYQQQHPSADDIALLLAQARHWLQHLPPHRVDTP